MRISHWLGSIALIVAASACDQARATGPILSTDANTAAASDACAGQIVAGIAKTWPWAHDDKIAFPPPPGAIALWIQTFGPALGISSVRDLQLRFCPVP